MEFQITITNQISEIQRKLRECNHECAQLTDLVAKSLPSLVQLKEKAENELKAKVSLIADLQKQLAALRNGELPEEVESLPEISDADPFGAEPEIVAPPVVPIVEEINVPEEKPQLTTAASNMVTNPSVSTTTPPPSTPSAPPANPKAKAKPKRSREGLEDFIGGNLLNKIGIGILIIGIGIFVKYAIDKDWIGEIGRVMIGLLSGGILMGVAHKLRKSYKAFSSVLLGGGVSVLYFTVGIAFHEYGLFSQTVAFALMCGITAATVFFSIAYDRQEIAILALLGSFATPFMVSQGDGNYVVLFSYILIVNIGMAILAWFRDWKLVRIIGYALTLLLFGGWVLKEYVDHSGKMPAGGLIFAMLFFVTFFITTVAYRVRKQQAADVFTYISLMSNSAFFYGISMVMLNGMDANQYMGIFTAGMAVFHFAFILPLRKMLKVGDHLQTMLIGLVLTFITLAVPIQLEGNAITLFWAAEAVLVLFLAQKTDLKLLKVGSVILSGLAIVMLFFYWSINFNEYYLVSHPLILNGAFLTSMLVAGSILLLRFLHSRKEKTDSFSKALAPVYQFVSLPLFYLGMVVELALWLKGEGPGVNSIAITAFTGLYLSGMMIWANVSKRKMFGNVVAILGVLTSVLWALIQVGLLDVMRYRFMSNPETAPFFPWHLLTFLSVGVLLVVCFRHVKNEIGLNSDFGKLLIYGFSLLAVMTLSLELDNVLAMLGVGAAGAHKVGYPILWGVSGFTMIALGMREKLVHLRIAGLALFCLIFLKLFLFDIWSVSAGGKIAAFISLGVLLLVISFMYQRLRKLLTDEEDKGEEAQQGE
mgnify:CR=1 FL=1